MVSLRAIALLDQAFCVLQIIEADRIFARSVREFEISESLIGFLHLKIDYAKIEVCHRRSPRSSLLEPPYCCVDIPTPRGLGTLLHMRNRPVGFENIPAMEFGFLLVDADPGGVLGRSWNTHQEEQQSGGKMECRNEGMRGEWTLCARFHGIQ
jgi:hypothetical protein